MMSPPLPRGRQQVRIYAEQYEVAECFPIRSVEAEGPFEVELEEGSGIDWLALHLGMTVDGERINLVRLRAGLLADKADAALIEGGDADAPPYAR